MTFELRVVGSDSKLQSPPLLTLADIASVRAVTKSAWYVLSGEYKSSKLVLTVKPASVVRWLNALGMVARRGDRVSVVVDGHSLGQWSLCKCQLALTLKSLERFSFPVTSQNSRKPSKHWPRESATR